MKKNQQNYLRGYTPINRIEDNIKAAKIHLGELDKKVQGEEVLRYEKKIESLELDLQKTLKDKLLLDEHINILSNIKKVLEYEKEAIVAKKKLKDLDISKLPNKDETNLDLYKNQFNEMINMEKNKIKMDSEKKITQALEELEKAKNYSELDGVMHDLSFLNQDLKNNLDAFGLKCLEKKLSDREIHHKTNMQAEKNETQEILNELKNGIDGKAGDSEIYKKAHEMQEKFNQFVENSNEIITLDKNRYFDKKLPQIGKEIAEARANILIKNNRKLNTAIDKIVEKCPELQSLREAQLKWKKELTKLDIVDFQQAQAEAEQLECKGNFKITRKDLFEKLTDGMQEELEKNNPKLKWLKEQVPRMEHDSTEIKSASIRLNRNLKNATQECKRIDSQAAKASDNKDAPKDNYIDPHKGNKPIDDRSPQVSKKADPEPRVKKSSGVKAPNDAVKSDGIFGKLGNIADKAGDAAFAGQSIWKGIAAADPHLAKEMANGVSWVGGKISTGISDVVHDWNNWSIGGDIDRGVSSVGSAISAIAKPFKPIFSKDDIVYDAGKSIWDVGKAAFDIFGGAWDVSTSFFGTGVVRY